MNKVLKYFLISIAIAAIGFVLWYFSNIVAYILIAGVLALVGRPICNALQKVRIGKLKIPKGISALFTLLTLWIIIFTFFRIFIPLVINEANAISKADLNPLLTQLHEPMLKVEEFVYEMNPDIDKTKEFNELVADKITSFVSVKLVSDVFGTIASLLGNIFIAVFAISFITFFFLKEENMFHDGILILIPTNYEEEVNRILASVKKLLTRYFLGICLQITGIIILVTLGLTIVGVGFKHGLVIGLVAGIMNVIPYLGPIIGSVLGILLGIGSHIELPFYEELLPLIALMALVFLIVQLIDNFLFQPIIYGNSVQAHPLEIFLVILIAGSLVGIAGMVLAIPAYTIIRVFAKEFFNNSKLVKKLTEKI